MRSILENADEEKRSTNEAEGAKFDELRSQADGLAKEIALYEAITDEQRNQQGQNVENAKVNLGNEELRHWIKTGELRSLLQFAKHFEAREIINGLTLGSSRKPHAHRTALHSAYLYYCERMGIINPLQRNRFRQAFEYALKERGSKNRLLTRIKDGLNVTNIYYINIEHSLKDWDS